VGIVVNPFTGLLEVTGTSGGPATSHPAVPTIADLPATAANGTTVVVQATDHLYIYDSTIPAWVDTGLTAATSVASSGNAAGYTLTPTVTGNVETTTLTLTPTDGESPGVITANPQAIGGVKTFLSDTLFQTSNDIGRVSIGNLTTNPSQPMISMRVEDAPSQGYGFDVMQDTAVTGDMYISSVESGVATERFRIARTAGTTILSGPGLNLNNGSGTQYGSVTNPSGTDLQITSSSGGLDLTAGAGNLTAQAGSSSITVNNSGTATIAASQEVINTPSSSSGGVQLQADGNQYGLLFNPGTSGDLEIAATNALLLKSQSTAPATVQAGLSSIAVNSSGTVSLSGTAIDANTTQIHNLAAGTSANDAVNYNQLTSLATGLLWQDPIKDPDLVNDSLSTPPVTPVYSITYIIAGSPTGAWTGLAGHAVWWDGTHWIDLSTGNTATSGLGTAVQVGDRFGVAISTAGASSYVGGGLTGKANDLVVITSNTPGSITYTTVAPANNYAVYVDTAGSQHYGSSFTYVASKTAWVGFSGPSKITAGAGLYYNGNTLNVGVDNTTIDITGTNLEVKSGGITNTQVSSTAAIALSKLAALTAHNRVLVSDSSGVVSESGVTSTTLGYLDATSSVQTQLNGKVTAVSVSSSNGFSGTSSGGTTPSLTLSTSASGVLKGSAGSLVAATAGTDFVVPSGSITGTASNITATSNSTLTTLSALSLPGSQVSGNISGSAASVSGTNVVSNTNLAQMAANTIKGNNTGATANAADLTSTQVTAMLNAFTSTLKGLVPASGGGTTTFLRADGTFAAPTSNAGPGDITPSTFSFANNQSTAANVTGLAFANATVGSFSALLRIQLLATTSLYGTVQLLGTQRGADWVLSSNYSGDETGLVFSITTAGQVQYQSTNATGFTSGTINFSATTLAP